MLERIKGFFDRHLGQAGEGGEARRLRLAAAALLLEMTRMDERVLPGECAAVEEAVRERFALTPEECRELLELADAERHDATDYFQFTSLIVRHWGMDERTALVEALWRVAYADSALSPYEEHLVRKVAQLLHVPHGAFVAAKHRSQPNA
jgi:uncharacterized tellurite resistance protein B-like protein